jgi:hypothetical protein
MASVIPVIGSVGADIVAKVGGLFAGMPDYFGPIVNLAGRVRYENIGANLERERTSRCR